jgi:hypothetical protein
MSRHHRIPLALALAATLLLWTGCASTYQVKVDAMRRPAPDGKAVESYQISNKNPMVEADSLRYREAAAQVKTALSANGLFEAPDASAADMIVEIDYGVTPVRVKYEDIDVPVVANSPVGPPPGALPPVMNDGSLRADGVGERNGREVVGSETVSRPVAVCEKYISVAGRENKPAAEGCPPVELWRVHVSIEDESRDLRDYLPLLTSVAMDQIGKETNGETIATLDSRDESIQFIRRGM